MKTNGDYRAKALKVCITKIGLVPASVADLEKILEEQFKEQTCIEISGAVFYKNNCLSLEMIYAQQIQEVVEALKLFQEGDYSSLKTLSDFAAQATEFHEEHHGKNTFFNAIYLSFQAAYQASVKDHRKISLSEKERKEWTDMYKELLRHYTIVPIGEKLKQQGFLGSFHVHGNGSKPSPADIAESLKVGCPELVISATSDYQQSGIKLYLIHAGSFELLYQGPLKSKE